MIDVDSTICEVAGKAKQGAGFGYTHVLGYHPLLATIAGTGEILHGRMRKGSANTQRGTKRFVNELVARARRDDPTRELTVRFDSGFWNNDTMLNLSRLDVRFTMAIRTNVGAVQTAIAGIADEAWQTIDYTCDGEAQVAECDYTSGQGTKRVTRRLVVRRTRLTGKAQQKLWPDWRHHAFLTDLDGDVIDVDRFHREHATVEFAIKDLKAGAGLEHLPSGVFCANSAWFQIAILAHNMMPLDRPPRRPRHRPTDRCAHHPHPAPRAARPTRQPRRTTNPAVAVPLAMGRHVHQDPRHAPRARTRPDLTLGLAVRRAAEPTSAPPTQPAPSLLQHAPTTAGSHASHLPRSATTAAPTTEPQSVDQGLRDGEWWLAVETRPGAQWCPGCGVRAVGHGRSRTTVRDLPIAGVPTVLVFARRRWRCPEPLCDVRTWSEHVDAIAPRASLTERARARLAEHGERR